MTQHKFASFFACLAAALMIATPATGQLVNFPVLALAPGGADGVTAVIAGFGRGLNDNSRKQTSFGAGIVRGMERVSFGVSGAYVASDTEEMTLGGRIAVHVLNDSDSPVSVSLQTGLGWMSFGADASLLNIPIGVAIQGNGDGNVTPWVMPRLQMTRVSIASLSATETDIGVSAGVNVSSEGGFGFGVSVDWINVEGGSPFFMSAGFSFVLGG